MLIYTDSTRIRDLIHEKDESLLALFGSKYPSKCNDIECEFIEDLPSLCKLNDESIIVYNDIVKVGSDLSQSGVESIQHKISSLNAWLSINSKSFIFSEIDLLVTTGYENEDELYSTLLLRDQLKANESLAEQLNKLTSTTIHTFHTEQGKYLEYLYGFLNSVSSQTAFRIDSLRQRHSDNVEFSLTFFRDELLILQKKVLNDESIIADKERLVQNLCKELDLSLNKNEEQKSKIDWFRNLQKKKEVELKKSKSNLEKLRKNSEEKEREMRSDIDGLERLLESEKEQVRSLTSQLSAQVKKVEKAKDELLSLKKYKLETERLSSLERAAKSKLEEANSKNEKLVKVLSIVLGDFDASNKGRKKISLRADTHSEEVKMLEESPLFDSKYYTDQLKSLGITNQKATEFFIKFGNEVELSPSASFDFKGYLNLYPDVKQSGMNPLLHYLKHGQNEGRLLPTKLLGTSKV